VGIRRSTVTDNFTVTELEEIGRGFKTICCKYYKGLKTSMIFLAYFLLGRYKKSPERKLPGLGF
jgi:hypothetical protein